MEKGKETWPGRPRKERRIRPGQGQQLLWPALVFSERTPTRKTREEHRVHQEDKMIVFRFPSRHRVDTCGASSLFHRMAVRQGPLLLSKLKSSKTSGIQARCWLLKLGKARSVVWLLPCMDRHCRRRSWPHSPTAAVPPVPAAAAVVGRDGQRLQLAATPDTCARTWSSEPPDSSIAVHLQDIGHRPVGSML